jgi:hypothetical protein
MYNEKSKHIDVERNAFRKGVRTGIFMVVGLLLVIGGVVHVYNSIFDEWFGPRITETIIVPFNRTEPTWTREAYSGVVYLLIRGTGQAAGSDFSDAFYQYTQDGQPLSVPRTHQFDLEIDGNRAIIMLGLEKNPPRYNLRHVYEATYFVGETPRQIAFRISDFTTDDNTEEFTIGIGATYDVIKGLFVLLRC